LVAPIFRQKIGQAVKSQANRGITIVWFGSSTLGRDRSASGRFERILEQALFDPTLEQPHCERENSGHAK
jgi:hypothetical protein